jgi:NAD(P)-dependent dehydrogenase (short-subunit alcohol dehydrogenase family)
MLSNKLDLSGKTALITGSSQGIGKGIAIAFAQSGANIILHYRKHKSETMAVAAEIKKFRVKVYVIQADFSKSNAVAGIYRKVYEKVKRLDILVLNASVQVPSEWLEVTAKDFDLQVTTNFRSTFQLIQKFAPDMIKNNWGRILTIGSVQQVKPHPAMIVYAATKSAVLNLVQNAAMQLADKNVTVNNLAPGVIRTQRLDEDVPESDERITKRMETPVGKVGTPEDCAVMALLLCSEAGNFITGQNIFVDGGMSL